MRLLIIHNEASYFAGAEQMLRYYLEGLRDSDIEVEVAVVPGSRTAAALPHGIATTPLHNSERFSVAGLSRQLRQLVAYHRCRRFALFHAWAARDWELSAALSLLCGRPAIGTLHDHPQATFISPARQRLMRWMAHGGLRRIACVSHAVADACRLAGYVPARISVIHNGVLPLIGPAGKTSIRPPGANCRLGYLGLLSERKGLRGLFEMIARVAEITVHPWELEIAGKPQDAAGETLVAQLRQAYAGAPWWPKIHWAGWVSPARDFLQKLDLLICPSTDFDPFPTVLLEAGQAGVPVLATRTGGAAEIVVDQETGWLIAAGDWENGARLVSRLVADPAARAAAGSAARQRVMEHFHIGKMVAKYRELYSSVLPYAT